MPCGQFGEQPAHQQFGEALRGRRGQVFETRLAVDAESDGHRAGRDGEERLIRARQRATAEGDAERTRAIVGEAGESLDLVERHPGLGCGTSDLEHDQVARDAAAAVPVGGGCAGDVVGHHDGAHVVALAAQPFFGLPELQDVAGVVAVAEQDARTALDGPGDARHLRRSAGEAKMLPQTAPAARPGPTTPANAG